MDTFEIKPAVAAPPRRSWRRHSDEFRARVTELARQPNTSVAAVALANGLNANMLRRWVREAEGIGVSEGGDTQQRDAGVPAFVQLPRCAASPVATSSALAETAVTVTVEIQRNGTTVRASLPFDSRSAAWLREVTG